MSMKITDVFTPRSHAVNPKTYVPRLDLELPLLRSVQGSMHSLLFGESGNGKSWLFKKVFDEHNIPYVVANCANASRKRSITEEIVSAVVPAGEARKTSYTETKEASVKAVVAEGKLVHEGHFQISRSDPLEDAFSHLSERAGKGPAVIVIDNLESIFDSADLMRELADVLILLDDDRYAKHRVKFLIVGVPNGVLEYFARTKNLESVSNRIEELPKVGSMTLPMVMVLVRVGFNELLKFGIKVEDLGVISRRVHEVTMGVAQRVHEFCEKLAYELEDSKKGFDADALARAEQAWLKQGLRKAYTVVESHLNSKRTTIARRNQVIFCIGKIAVHQFDSSRIVDLLQSEFPETVKNKNMGVSGILSDLASGECPVLKKNPKTNEYRVVDPRYVMCMRIMLRKNSATGAVEKLAFKV